MESAAHGDAVPCFDRIFDFATDEVHKDDPEIEGRVMKHDSLPLVRNHERSQILRVDDGVPFVLESAFSWLGDDAADERHIFAGANWSPGISNPFRSFGKTGEGLEAVLTEQRAGAREPIVFLLHLAHPRVEYKDRGKSSIVIGGAEDAS